MVTSTLQSTHAPTRLKARDMRPRLIAALCALLAGLAFSAAGAAQASAAPSKLYTVCVKTADEPNAGTDSDVMLEVRGTNGWTGFVTLDDSRDNFERNTTDCFSYFAHDVQTITSVRVWTNGNSNWKLSWVNVNGVTFGFNVWMHPGITSS